MFTGFSEKTSAFLWDIRFNNEREWFHAHKSEFDKHVNTPMKSLAADVRDLMQEKYPQYDWQIHVSRIWRDARRLFGRGPLKDHLWFSIYRTGAAESEPDFWFGIGPTYFTWGMGFFDARAAFLEKYRQAIDANPARFERIITELAKSNHLVCKGDCYKRLKADRGELLNPWYNTRGFAVEYSDDFGPRIFSEDLPREIFRDYESLMPLYQWLLELFGGADGPGPEWEIK